MKWLYSTHHTIISHSSKALAGPDALLFCEAKKQHITKFMAINAEICTIIFGWKYEIHVNNR